MKKIISFFAVMLVSTLAVRAETNPPAFFAKGEKILFQGDSITDGGRGRNYEDLNHIFGHGYVFIIAAKYGAMYPELDLKFFNRGVSGHTLTDLRNRWQKDTLDLEPDVLSILVGVNDTGRLQRKEPGGLEVAAFEKSYDELLQETIAKRPGIKIILGEPFVLESGKRKGEEWGQWKEDVKKRQEAVKRLGEKYKIPVVRFQKIFNDACRHAPAAYWIWDDVHPTAAGHQLMADEWVRVYREFYTRKKK